MASGDPPLCLRFGHGRHRRLQLGRVRERRLLGGVLLLQRQLQWRQSIDHAQIAAITAGLCIDGRRSNVYAQLENLMSRSSIKEVPFQAGCAAQTKHLVSS